MLLTVLLLVVAVLGVVILASNTTALWNSVPPTVVSSTPQAIWYACNRGDAAGAVQIVTEQIARAEMAEDLSCVRLQQP
jgi:hypothetical protein